MTVNGHQSQQANKPGSAWAWVTIQLQVRPGWVMKCASSEEVKCKLVQYLRRWGLIVYPNVWREKRISTGETTGLLLWAALLFQVWGVCLESVGQMSKKAHLHNILHSKAMCFPLVSFLEMAEPGFGWNLKTTHPQNQPEVVMQLRKFQHRWLNLNYVKKI